MGVRADILAICASWAGLIADEQGLAERPARRVPELAEFVIAELAWLSRHQAAAEAASEFARVTAAAEAALEPEPGRHVELGRCDKPGCNAVMRAVIGGRRSGVACDGGHARGASEWLRVAGRVGRDGR